MIYVVATTDIKPEHRDAAREALARMNETAATK